jgi:hypothetical protein
MPFSFTFAASGGVAPYRWSVSSATPLPPGLDLSSAGLLSGTAEVAGTTSLAVTVEDAGGLSASASVTLVVAAQPANGGCAAPTPIVLSADAATIPGTLEGAQAGGAGRDCKESPLGQDRYYSLVLTDAAVVSVALASESGAVATIYPAGCAAGSNVGACRSTLTQLLAPGTWVIAVTGPAADAFILSVTVHPFSGNGCGEPIPVDLSGGSALITGDFSGATRAYATTCSTGVQKIYALTLPRAGDLHITDEGTPFVIAKDLRQAPCDTGAELACGNALVETLIQPNLAAGTYYLFLELPAGPTSTGFTERIELDAPTPPAVNDACPNPTPVQFTGDSLTVSGTMVGATYDGIPTSCGAAANDLWYTFELAEASSLTVTHSSTVTVDLLTGPCNQLLQPTCDPCVNRVPPGRYLLRVVQNSLPADAFTVTVTRSDPPPAPANETCATATPIALNGGKGSVSGALPTATDAVPPSCAPATGPRHSVAYTLSLAQASDLTVSMDGDGTSEWWLDVVSGDCATGSSLSCVDMGDRSFMVPNVPAGEVSLKLEGGEEISTSACWSGAYTLSVSATPVPPEPANDTCATAQVVAFPGGAGNDVRISGSTDGAAATLGAVDCAPGFGGPAVAYALVLPTSAVVQITPVSSFPNLAYYLTSACGTAHALACGMGSGTGFVTDVLPAGTYDLVVGSLSAAFATEVGAFTFDIALF